MWFWYDSSVPMSPSPAMRDFPGSVLGWPEGSLGAPIQQDSCAFSSGPRFTPGHDSVLEADGLARHPMEKGESCSAEQRHSTQARMWDLLERPLEQV